MSQGRLASPAHRWMMNPGRISVFRSCLSFPVLQSDVLCDVAFMKNTSH